MLDTYYEENLELNRPYEDSWFRIIVRNKDYRRSYFRGWYWQKLLPSRHQNNW